MTMKNGTRRIKFHRGSIDSTMAAAIRASSGATVYVFGTANGFVIHPEPAPFGRRCYKVTGGAVEKVGDWS
jgi:hypothetical protein